jgi:hypothetical protein
LKDDPPSKYSGEPKAGTFKKWVREIRDWTHNGRLSDSQAIRCCGKYSTGKAYRFYEQEICTRKKKYSLSEYFMALFNYCFPASFRMQQRDKFDACKQNDMSAIDYLRKLQDVADTVGDITEDDIVLAFFRRASVYLRVKLADAGYEPSDLTLDQLEDKIIALDRGNEISEEERKRSSKDKTHRDHDSSKKSPGVRTPSDRNAKASGSGFGNTNSSKNDRKSKPPFKRGKGAKDDLDRMKRLRDEKRCFECESPDHMAKDCPRRHNKKPPLTLNSMELMSPTEIRLAALNEGTNLGLFGVTVADWPLNWSDPECVGNRIRRREVLWTLALAKLHDAVPLPFDELENPIVDPYANDRFSFMEWGRINTYLLQDEHNGDEHILYYSDLVDPEFDLLHWLFTEKAKIFDELLRAPAFVPSNESTSDGSDSENASDDDFDDDFGYNSPCSASDLSDSSEPFADLPPLVPVDTDISGASYMSSYITDIEFEDPDASSEGEWIECLVHKLKIAKIAKISVLIHSLSIYK